MKSGLKLAGEVEERRNQVVHSHWFINSGYLPSVDAMTRMKTKTKRGALAIAFEHETVKDFNDVTEKAFEAQGLIGSALRDYRQITQAEW